MALNPDKIQSKTTERAMSLLEVLLVLVIVGVIFGVVTGSFRTSRAQIMNDLHALRLDIKSASRTAILSGNVHRLVYDLEKNHYWLEFTEHKSLTIENFREQSEKYIGEKLKEELKKYEDLAGPEVSNDKGEKLPIPSVVVTQLKERRSLRWNKAQDLGQHSFKALVLKEFKNSRMEVLATIKSLREQSQKQISILLFPSGKIEASTLLLTPKSAPDQTFHFVIIDDSKIEFGANTYIDKKSS